MAQKTRPTIQTQINSDLASGTKITAAKLRTTVSDLLDSSFVKLSDGISGIQGLEEALDVLDDTKADKVSTAIEKAFLTQGSLNLITLVHVPTNASTMQVFLNGLLLDNDTDWEIDSGTTLIATEALNESLGGTDDDGEGFESTDEIKVIYEYVSM